MGLKIMVVETVVGVEMVDELASKVREGWRCRSLWVKVGSEEK